MPRPTDINPQTGKRYDFVPPEKRLSDREAQRRAVEQDIRLLHRVELAKRARDDLMVFTQFTMPDVEHPDDPTKSAYQAARFHYEVAKVLEQVIRGEITQLIFCMPPRHGKTELATKKLSAWFSGKFPQHDVIVASASDLLAGDFGADVRALMHSKRFKLVFPQHKLRRGGNAKDNIQTDRGGRLVFAGRGGTINGRGAHLLLVDDLYKDDVEAQSQTIRDQAWNWFTKVALYRRMGKRLTVLTMTRWHSDDIIGRLTDPENPHYNEQEARAWKIIRLPGVAEEDDPLGRKPGEALWPERYDEDYHRGNQRRDPLGFAALTQQRPTVADGVLFRRENVQYYRSHELPDSLRFYCASDHAVGLKQRNDPSCFIKVGIDPQSNIYLIECFWQRVSTDRAVEAMLEMASGNMAPLLWWAEKGHISDSIGPFLRKRMQETGTYINIIEVVPKQDKAQRAQSIAARMGMGKLFFPKDAWFTERAVNELMAFPNGVHDDFVDALAHIGNGLQSQFAAPKQAPVKEPKFGTLAWVKQQDAWKKQRAEQQHRGGF